MSNEYEYVLKRISFKITDRHLVAWVIDEAKFNLLPIKLNTN